MITILLIIVAKNLSKELLLKISETRFHPKKSCHKKDFQTLFEQFN